jgi:hypothetical protein
VKVCAATKFLDVDSRRDAPQANYFVAHPTAVSLALLTHSKIAVSALLIGIPAISAMVMALVHCKLLAWESTGTLSFGMCVPWLFAFFLFASLTALAANIVHAYGIWQVSLPVMVRRRSVSCLR